MNTLRNVRIGYRLAIGFSIVLCLSLSITALSIWRLGVIDSATRQLMETPLMKERLISDLSSNVSAGIRRTIAIVKSSDPSLATYFLADAQELQKKGSGIVKKLEELLSSTEERAMFERLIKARSDFNTNRDLIMKQKASGDSDATEKLSNEKFNPSVAAYQSALRDILTFQRKEMDTIGASVADISGQSRTLLVSISGLMLLLCSTIAWLITTSITAPLRSALNIVNTVAKGDLTTRLVIAGNDELGQLLTSLQEMNDNLRRMVIGVRTSSHTIAHGAGEIALGNQDLSSRTERQAASLEETASSMEELTSTVKQNAESATYANQLTVTASAIAVEGGEIVSKVVDTMELINTSSRRIVEIISVVDGIAFQTNILALNAAVEAARAGEQGRGFAVVASEVRSLAHRSAAAAKEIKALIDESVQKVDTGSVLVAQAGSTMGEIVKSVKRVTDIMGEIMAANHEQSMGITQINGAVNEMDHVTQQNAALVEEAAAATEALKIEANHLSEAVSAFKVEDTLAC
jgi:methyl-accepting chemotaxis protein